MCAPAWHNSAVDPSTRSAVVWRAPDRKPSSVIGRLRPTAEAAVLAPDGREFVVRVRRVLWPGHSRRAGATRDIVKDGLTGGVAGGVLDLFTPPRDVACASFRRKDQTRCKAVDLRRGMA